jgi:hypothetical protein
MICRLLYILVPAHALKNENHKVQTSGFGSCNGGQGRLRGEGADLAKCEMCPALSNQARTGSIISSPQCRGFPVPLVLFARWDYLRPVTVGIIIYHVPIDSISEEPDFTDTSELQLKLPPMKKYLNVKEKCTGRAVP